MKGVIIETKDQYTYVLCHHSKMRRIKRQYHHEIGNEITLPLISSRVIGTLALGMCVLLAILFNPMQTQTVKALSYISLSVNPGLVLKIDDHKKVQSVSYTNQDGKTLTEQIDFVNKDLNDCVILFIDYCFDNNLFNSDHSMSINVMSDDSSNISSLEKEIQEIIDYYLKTNSKTIQLSLDQVSSSQHQTAQEYGIPDSKMKLVDLVSKYYPSLDKAKLAKMSVDDLIDYLEDKGYDEDVLDRLEDELEAKEEKKTNTTSKTSTSSKDSDDDDDDDDDDHDEEDDDDDDDDD